MKTVTVSAKDRAWVFTNCIFSEKDDGSLTVTDIQHKETVARFPSGCWYAVINQNAPDEPILTGEQKLKQENAAHLDDIAGRAS